MYELIVPWLFSEPFLANPDNAGYLKFDDNDPFQQPLHAFKRQYLAQREFDFRNNLRLIQAATLVLAGELDVLATVGDSAAIARGIPRAEMSIIPNTGHLSNLEQPELFHKAFIGFLILTGI